MFISGANNLYNHYPEIDRLNVFPVPDGDTGMNMNLTFTSGMKEIQNRSDDNVYDLAKYFSRGLLMGARGNSGVITCQIFRGFADSLEGKKIIKPVDLIEAFKMAKEVAYKAVMKPVEGTILTVIRESSTKLVEAGKENDSIEDLMDLLLDEAYASLQRTPELLPVLKEVGVVDSGGTGLWRIIEGMDSAVHGKIIKRIDNVERSAIDPHPEIIAQPKREYAGAKLVEDEEGYGYCTQFILRLGKEEDGKKPFNENKFKHFLTTHGKSLVVVSDGDIVKVHVHTLTPGNMLNYAQNFGEFVSIIIENMSEEHHNIEEGRIATDMEGNIEAGKKKEKDDTPLKEYGIIAVSSGKGLDEIFKECGADAIVGGGQTMNPSTEDFINAIKEVHAKNIFILPNNSNIVMAASQACEVVGGEINARVISSTTLPQGIAACLQFNPDEKPNVNFRNMKSALKSVASGSVTYAVRDTEIDGILIKKDYYMAMSGKKIIACYQDKIETLFSLIDSMNDGERFSLMLYLGEDVSKEEEESLSKTLEEKYSDDLEIIIRRGDQPVYSFIIGME